MNKSISYRKVKILFEAAIIFTAAIPTPLSSKAYSYAYFVPKSNLSSVSTFLYCLNIATPIWLIYVNNVAIYYGINNS